MAKVSHNLRLVGFLLLILVYSVLANYTLQSKENATIGALLAMGPIVLSCIVIAYKAKRRLLMFSLLLIGSFLLVLAWTHFEQHYDWIYWLMHESLQLVLFTMFARTLRKGQQPLCTQFAKVIHGSLSPQLISYTRKVTIAWALFFAIITMISTCLFFFYPIRIWSIFSNFAYLPLIAMMFIVEYMVRIWVLPKEDRTNIMDAIHTFMDKS